MLATTSVEDDANKWDCHVKEIQSALNTSFNKSINTTPVKALFGYQTKPIAEASLLNTLQTSVEKVNIADLRNRIAEHINHDQRKQKERYDKRRREATRFDQGDLVRLLITSEPGTGSSKKLLPKYKGPFRVIKVLFNDRYEVEDLRENRRRRNVRTVVAADKMEKWIKMMKEQRVDGGHRTSRRGWQQPRPILSACCRSLDGWRGLVIRRVDEEGGN